MLWRLTFSGLLSSTQSSSLLVEALVHTFMVSKLGYDLLPWQYPRRGKDLRCILIVENMALTYDPNWMTNLLEELLEETQGNEDTSRELSKTTAETSSMPEDCRLEVWQCMSGVLESGIRYVETPRDIYR